jgi:Domain of unknown function (DU1801)
MNTRPPGELLEFLHPYDPAVAALALGLRTVVLREMAPCHEYIFSMRSKIVLLYGLTERVIADAVCSISVLAKHATLMFHRGKDLSDPQRILEGRGKVMRHVKLTRLSELDRPELRAFLREARRRAGGGRRRHAGPAMVVTRVKKRRRADNLLDPRLV